MTTSFPTTPALIAGEFSPLYEGRVDLSAYPAAAKSLQNFIPVIQGAGDRRPGTRFVAEVKDSSAQTWIVPFIRARKTAYVIEFGNLYCRFIFQRGLVLTGSPSSIVNISQGSPAVVTTAVAHGYSNDQDVYITGVTGMTEVNDRFFRVANATSTTFELKDMFSDDVISTAYTAYSTGGTVDKPYELTTPWNSAALTADDGEFALDVAQDSDVLYVVDRRGALAPRKISRTSSSSWAISTVQPDDGPFLDQNSTDEVIVAHGASGSVTLQSSTSTFNSNHVGALVRIDQRNLTATAPWKTATAYSANDYVRSEGHEYQAQNSATSGVTVPAHTDGVATDDDVDWQYITSGYGIARITAVDAAGDKATATTLTTFPQTTVLDPSTASGSEAISSVTQANPAVVTTGTHGYSDGDLVYITGGDMVEITGRWYIVANSTSTTFELTDLSGANVDSTGFTAYTSGGSCADLAASSYNDQASTLWQLGAWSDDNGYPQAVSLFLQSRLAFGQGNTLFMSVSGDLESFAEDEFGQQVATSSIRTNLSSDQVNQITSLLSTSSALLVFTEGAEWQIRSLSTAEAFGPLNIDPREETAYGSRAIQPIRVGESVLFVTTSGRKLRQLRYSFEAENLLAPEMTVRADHIMRIGSTWMSWVNEPTKSLLVGRSDGQILNFTYDRDQEVFGWSRFVIGGVFGSGAAVCESGCAIPDPDNTRDEPFIIVKRTINSQTKRYIEYISPKTEEEDDDTLAVYVDSAVVEQNGSEVASATGLHHLKGLTVSYVGDGSYHGEITVAADGSATGTSNAANIVAGIKYRSEYISLKSNPASSAGTSQGKVQRAADIVYRVDRTRGGQGGTDVDDLTDIPDLNYRDPNTPVGSAPPLITGDIQLRPKTQWSDDSRVVFVTEEPFPATLLAVFPKMRVQDDRR